MTRRDLSVMVDGQLVEATARAARADGVSSDEVVEEALRRYFGLRGLAVLDEISEAQRTTDAPALTEDEATALAVTEVRAARAERAAARSPRKSAVAF